MFVILQQKLAFLAIPKTGTTSIEKALRGEADIIMRKPPQVKHMTVMTFESFIRPYLKKIGVYKLVQIAVRAAEKLGATGAIEKADKKKYVMEALERLGVKITPTIETMIEAAVKEMDIQNNKIKDEFKKN